MTVTRQMFLYSITVGSNFYKIGGWNLISKNINISKGGPQYEYDSWGFPPDSSQVGSPCFLKAVLSLLYLL
jgi:hypothetical protein